MTKKNELDFDKVLSKNLTRRDFLKGGTLAFGASAFALSTGTASMLVSQSAKAGFWQGNDALLDFKPVSANILDTITIPSEFDWHRVVSWGDPIFPNGSWFNHYTRGDAKSQSLAFGDNTDGMDIFTKDSRTILAANNEYINKSIFYNNRDSKLPENADDIAKGKAAHGVSVVKLVQKKGKWQVQKNSEFNRKITADSPMEITGPAKGHALMKTQADPTGTKSLGTWNNCGNGKTPWGTYLTCEENFNGYFSSSDPALELTDEFKRYGIKHKDRGYGWGQYDERFDISKHPTEPNRAGFIVEIDPLDPNSTPKKRTALGRFKHENAEVVVATNGHVVVYLGDDERGEYLYKFISKNKYSRHENNQNILDDGDLYVAKFNDDGSGKWLHLTPESTGMASKAEICINTRMAASAVKATTMDRPEWVAAHPHKAEIYCALTNNKNRGIKPNAGGDATSVDAVNPRKGNKYGQIVRWNPLNNDHTSSQFNWDLFALAGNPEVHKNNLKSGSNNITKFNMFNSPDGLKFDSKGGLWIQTDGKYSNKDDFAGMGNNQMLLGNPETGEIKRFLVGPKECEVTGLTWSDDKKTMFVGIQHPGEKGYSNFPGGAGTAPRSTVIAITRKDGGEMG